MSYLDEMLRRRVLPRLAGAFGAAKNALRIESPTQAMIGQLTGEGYARAIRQTIEATFLEAAEGEDLDLMARALYGLDRRSPSLAVCIGESGFAYYKRGYRDSLRVFPYSYPKRRPTLCRAHEDCRACPPLAHACWERTVETRNDPEARYARHLRKRR